MALPPNIPTSFVPKQPVSTQPRRKRENGIFYYVALFILGVAVVGAGLTFGYEKFLESVRNARAAELAKAEQQVNAETVEDFIRLRNRIRIAQGLLDQHVYASQFFDVLEGLTLQNVRFQSLIMSVGDDRTAKIEMHGIARSFNALAAESAAFAGEKRIRRAIFSNIMADKNGVVNFSLRAEIDPKLIQRASDEVNADIEPPVTAPNLSTSTPQITGTTTKPSATTTKP